MRRRSLLALALPLVFATPSIAQSAADQSRQAYGPTEQTPKPVPDPPERSRSYLLPDSTGLSPSSSDPNFLTSSDLGQRAALGLGSIRTRSVTQPFSARRQEPANSRIAAVGFAVKF
jgi:hypothetical protein